MGDFARQKTYRDARRFFMVAFESVCQERRQERGEDNQHDSTHCVG